uniref:Neprosin PEP catalytic domain-containing protein n=2 Tax=Aegilops tauschii subsp. strangulata TaxID=200361 RepID=A0A453J358_AEGTS
NKSSYNVIQVGWHINPDRYGDSHPHFYTCWTDKKSGDWWVYYGFNKIPTGVGYFPRSLFSYLAEKADGMQFGAFVKSKKALPTPPMGSGALPNGGKGRAASFTDIRFID